LQKQGCRHGDKCVVPRFGETGLMTSEDAMWRPRAAIGLLLVVVVFFLL